MSAGDVFKVVAGVLASVGLGGGIVIALASYLGKIWAARILEADRAKYSKEVGLLLAGFRSRSEREAFVHKLQFEKEFEVYTQMWKNAVHVGRAIVSLRPIIDSYDPNQSEEERIKERLERLYETYKPFNDSVYEFKPFIAPEVFEIAKELVKAINNENREYLMYLEDGKVRYEKRKDYWDQTIKNHDEINGLVDALCDAIRVRVWPAEVSTAVAAQPTATEAQEAATL